MASEERRGSESGEPTPPPKTNINDATRDDLVRVDGIGEPTAEQLLDYREDIGPFRSMEELTNIPMITDDKLELLERHFTA